MGLYLSRLGPTNQEKEEVMNYIDEPLADWERELLGHERKVFVRLTVHQHDGTVLSVDGVNPETFVWVHYRTETSGGWSNDAPLTLSVASEDDGPIHYIPNVHRWTTETIVEWVPSK